MEMQQRDIAVRVSRSPEDAGFEVRVGKGRPLEMPIVVEDLDCLPSGLMNRITQASAVEVRSCSLERVPSWVFEIPQLTVLLLPENKLTALPPEITELTELILLDLHGNGLRKLPPGIGGLRELTHLFVSGNELTALPEGIRNLRKLILLDLHGNPLTDLPKGIRELEKLETLVVGGNGLTPRTLNTVVPSRCKVIEEDHYCDVCG